MIKPGPNGTGGPALLLNKREYGHPSCRDVSSLVALLSAGPVETWPVKLGKRVSPAGVDDGAPAKGPSASTKKKKKTPKKEKTLSEAERNASESEAAIFQQL